MIGSELAYELLRVGHSVHGLSRSVASAKRKVQGPVDWFEWDGSDEFPAKALHGVDAVVHLAGESIVGKRWTKTFKKRLRHSRISYGKKLCAAISQHSPNLKAFIGGSAIGIYGDCGDKVVSETQEPASDFMADLCRDWEASYDLPQSVRKVVLRISVVLGHDHGFFQRVLPLFQYGVAGALGSGKQWMSWIHLDDLVGLITAALKNDSFSGVYNASAPEPATNAHLTKVFANELGRFVMPAAPRFALKAALGEVSAVMLQSARLDASKLLAAGYNCKFPTIDSALANLCTDYKNMGRRFFMRQWVPLSKSDTFSFFSDHHNLEVITPPKLKFRVEGMDTEKIQEGSLIDYKLQLSGVPFRWRTKIESWDPEDSFTDTQLKGPYKLWHHTHSFEAMGEGTLMTDLVRYKLPMGYLGRLGGGWYVDGNVRSIFNYRFDNLEKILGASHS
jgi:uncharacterized protein (TIGR01777 family)